ncbi:MAG: OmpH family outer membrane protein [Phycisphaerae bacterium]|jgi:Skp family chaperone for outer membrane proteins
MQRSDSFRRLTSAVLIGIAVIGGSAMLVNAVPSAMAPAPAPASVGLVNLEALMNNLTELKDRNAEVKIISDEMIAKRTKLAEEVKEIEAQLSTSVPASNMQERVRMTAELAEKRQLLKIRSEGFSAQIDVINAQIIRELYGKVTKAIEEVAKREGYSLVLLDDRGIELSPQMSSDAVNQVILNKRILFADGSLDITDRIATVMNNDYAAAKTK